MLAQHLIGTCSIFETSPQRQEDKTINSHKLRQTIYKNSSKWCIVNLWLCLSHKFKRKFNFIGNFDEWQNGQHIFYENVYFLLKLKMVSNYVKFCINIVVIIILFFGLADVAEGKFIFLNYETN